MDKSSRGIKPIVILSVTNDTHTDQRVHRMARTLFDIGFDVVVAGRKTAYIPEQPYYCKIVLLPVFFKKTAAFYAEFNIRLFFFLLFKKADIFTANDLDTLPANCLASFFRRKKLVYDSHEYFTETPEIQHKPFVKKFWQLIEKVFIRCIDKGMTVSASIAGQLKETYNVDLDVVRNVPFKEAAFQRIKLPDFFGNKPVVLYQGSLNQGRGLEMAIRSMKHLDDVMLVIAGTGDIDDELKKLTTDLGLQEKVHFAGRIPFMQLKSYTTQASLGISIEENLGKNYRFALPNKLFDYIQAGVPAIVSDLPEMRSLVEKHKVGIVLESYSDECLASSIKMLLNNREMLHEYKDNCLIAARELCWEKESVKVNDIYSSLLKA